MRYFIQILIASALLVSSQLSFAVDNMIEAGGSNANASAASEAKAETKNATEAQNFSGRVEEILIRALSLTGIQYKYGGSSPETGFDCSGFVRYVFSNAANLTLPPTARAISQMGKSVSKDELKPGDLVFFDTLKNAFSHVGIYLGGNRFIHAPRSGAAVRVENLNAKYWQQHFNGAKRVTEDNATAESN